MQQLGATDFRVEEAEAEFLKALEGVSDPETKRHIIGEQFVAVQERILSTGHFLDGHWILGQGTIYPDTIESGGTAKADVIKTHHNRVAGIQKLIESGRIIEPLASFYKDEVREIGAELGIPARVSASASFSRPRPGDSLPMFRDGRAGHAQRSRLAAAHPIGGRERRFAQLSFRARARQRAGRRNRHRSW